MPERALDAVATTSGGGETFGLRTHGLCTAFAFSNPGHQGVVSRNSGKSSKKPRQVAGAFFLVARTHCTFTLPDIPA